MFGFVKNTSMIIIFKNTFNLAKINLLMKQNIHKRSNLFHYLTNAISYKNAGPNGHLNISYTLTAEIESDKISRNHLICINVQCFIICCFTSMVNV